MIFSGSKGVTGAQVEQRCAGAQCKNECYLVAQNGLHSLWLKRAQNGSLELNKKNGAH